METIQNFSGNGSTQLSRFDYTYNPVGTIATWTQQADSSTAVVNTLTYDNADQLISDVQGGGGSASNAYAYDPAGNRLAETTSSGTTVGSFNNLNQLLSLTSSPTSQTVSGYTSGAVTSVTVNAVPATLSNGTNFTASVPLAPGTSNMVSVVAQPSSSTGTFTTQRYGIVTSGTAPTPLAYDINGNVTTDENGNNYTWDALNRLTAIVYNSGANSGNHTEFAYDGLSRRVQIVERTGTTVGSGTVTSTKNYLWIGSEIAEERDASNNVTKRFFSQGEQQNVSGTVTPYYYTSDHEGSVREVCNSSGTIVARYSYDPYGRTSLVSGTNIATFQYTHDYYHATSGLNLTMYRAYDPSTGRWLNRDIIQEHGGLNLYKYAKDDPICFTDPLGLDTTTMSITITPNIFAHPNVTITAQSYCCKHLEFIQLTRSRYTYFPWGGLGNDPLGTPFYPSTGGIDPKTGKYNGSPISMPDAPGPGSEDSGVTENAFLNFVAIMTNGLIQDFYTCAVCRDPGPNFNKVMACIHWRTISNGIASKGLGAANYVPPGSSSNSTEAP